MIPASVSSPFLSPTSLVLLSTTTASFSPLVHFLMLAKSFPHLCRQELKIYKYCTQVLLPHTFPDCSLLPFAETLNLDTVFWRPAKLISSFFFPALACFICDSLESETELEQFRCWLPQQECSSKGDFLFSLSMACFQMQIQFHI